MKKHFLIAAAAALFFAAGCERTNSIPVDQSRIVVKLNGVKAVTRSVEAPAVLTGDEEDESTATLVNATVFVISETEGVYSEPMDVEKALDAGYTIAEDASPNGGPRLFSSDSKVYVLGNVPSDVDVATLKSWKAIEEAVSVISYPVDAEDEEGGEEGEEENAGKNVDFTKPAMANATGEPAVLKSGEDSNTATVDIDLSPLYSRVELHKVTGGKHIQEFTVAGVYINNFYRAFDMTGKGYKDDNNGLPFYEHVSGSKDFNGTFGDENGNTGWKSTTGVVGENTMTTNALATAGTGKVWAYNVGSGSVVTFIIRLTGVKYYAEVEPGVFAGTTTTYPGEMYLNVRGYKDFNGDFQRGYIYTIDDLEFDTTDLSDSPATGVSITANVNVNNWKVEKVTPILGD